MRFEQGTLRPLFASEAQEEGHARGRKYCLADGEGDNGPKRRKRVREAEGIRRWAGRRVRECDGNGTRRGGKGSFFPPGREVDGERGGGANTGGLERQGKSNDRHMPDSDLWKETSNQRIRCHAHPFSTFRSNLRAFFSLLPASLPLF